jgi:hypothetical protein
MDMKKKLMLFVLLAGLTLTGVTPLSNAQEKPAAQKFEYGMVKWDGPDKIQYILPDKFELARLAGKYPLPKDAQAEEFYLTAAANELAKQGWEAVNLNSRRILLRRPISK